MDLLTRPDTDGKGDEEDDTDLLSNLEDKGLELIDEDTKALLLSVDLTVEVIETRADVDSLARPLGVFDFKGDRVVERLTAGEDEAEAHADCRTE